MVSLIGLVAVAPAFVAAAPQLAALWRHPGYGHAGMVLALAAAWCLAVGCVLSDLVGRPADHRAAGAPELAEEVKEGRMGGPR